MLVIKPWYLYREHKAKLFAGYAVVEGNSPDSTSTGGSPNHGHGSQVVNVHHGEVSDVYCVRLFYASCNYTSLILVK
jgi:hypothetical protein